MFLYSLLTHEDLLKKSQSRIWGEDNVVNMAVHMTRLRPKDGP